MRTVLIGIFFAVYSFGALAEESPTVEQAIRAQLGDLVFSNTVLKNQLSEAIKKIAEQAKELKDREKDKCK